MDNRDQFSAEQHEREISQLQLWLQVIKQESILLNIEMALEIGINACIEKLGREFVRTHREQAVAAFGEYESGVFCFVGVDEDTVHENSDTVFILDSCSVFPYRVSCYVSLGDGTLSFVECILPTS